MTRVRVFFPKGLERFVSLEEFYSADERRRHSGEADYGIYWWDGLQGHSDTWRVSAVAQTGEIYAELEHVLREPYPEFAPVVLLGTFEIQGADYPYEDADRILAGWNLKCGESSSLQWVLDRVVDPAAMRGTVSVLCRCQTLGNHVHAAVFVGRAAGSRARAGELIMGEDEWRVFRAALEQGFGPALDLELDAPPEVEPAS